MAVTLRWTLVLVGYDECYGITNDELCVCPTVHGTSLRLLFPPSVWCCAALCAASVRRRFVAQSPSALAATRCVACGAGGSS